MQIVVNAIVAKQFVSDKGAAYITLFDLDAGAEFKFQWRDGRLDEKSLARVPRKLLLDGAELRQGRDGVYLTVNSISALPQDK